MSSAGIIRNTDASLFQKLNNYALEYKITERRKRTDRQERSDGLQDSNTHVDHFKHLDTIDINLLEFRIIGGVSRLGNRNFSPFLIGGYRDALVLEGFELFVGPLRLETTLSLDKW